MCVCVCPVQLNNFPMENNKRRSKKIRKNTMRKTETETQQQNKKKKKRNNICMQTGKTGHLLFLLTCRFYLLFPFLPLLPFAPPCCLCLHVPPPLHCDCCICSCDLCGFQIAKFAEADIYSAATARHGRGDRTRERA